MIVPRYPHSWTAILVASTVMFSACQLSELLNGDSADILKLNPSIIADSIPRGSRIPHTRTVSVSGDLVTGTAWQASIAGESPWLRLQSGRDTVPGRLVMAIEPTALAPGDYQDTVLILMEGVAEPVRVPVQVVVLPSGPAERLAFTARPPDALEDEPISPAVEVVAMDAFGNLATSYGGMVTVDLAAGRWGARLSGTTTVTATNGVARFTDLVISRDGNGYRLRATADGLAGATSSSFRVRDDD